MTRWASSLSVFLNLPCPSTEKVSCMPELVLDFRHRANLFLSLFQKIPLGAGFGSIRNSRVAYKQLWLSTVILRLPLNANLGVIRNSRVVHKALVKRMIVYSYTVSKAFGA